MSTVGQIERETQNRVIKLFKDKLKYRYLGNWEKRENSYRLSSKIDPLFHIKLIHLVKKLIRFFK